MSKGRLLLAVISMQCGRSGFKCMDFLASVLTFICHAPYSNMSGYEARPAHKMGEWRDSFSRKHEILDALPGVG